MKTKLQYMFTALALLALSILNAQLATAFAQGTAFTYQGRLNDGANPANGSYDLTFALFSVGSGGSAVAGPLTNSATGVSNGLFTVTLDFGDNFPGADRWLEIAVRTNGTEAFSALSPRQKFTATPYAVTAGNLTGTLPATQLTGSIPAGQLIGTLPDARLTPNIARLNVPNTALTATGVPVVSSGGGSIFTANVTFGGSGYSVVPLVTVNPVGGGAGANIVTTISNGMVTALIVTMPGAGYTTNATLTIAAPPSNAYQTFLGTNIFTGLNTMTNPANVFAGTFNGNATGFSGSLAGDVTGTQGATVVARVGGQTAASVADGANAANDATSANIANTIVKRDASGGFSAGTIAASEFNGDGSGLTNVNGTVPWQIITGVAQQAQADTGYMATNSSLVTITLPATPGIGDIVRVTGSGTNGWKIAQNTNQFVLCANLPGNPSLTGNPLASWTPEETNRNWSSIAMSADASTIVALDYGGHIHVSTDSGQTWSVHANARNWISVKCSSNGGNMLAADFQGQLYTSTNSGSNWTARDTNRWWTAVAYGSHLIAGESSPGPIYISFDSGASWISFSSGFGNWTAIACSSDVNDIYAADSIGVLRTSHDGGPTWGNMDATAPTYDWSSIACSADGSKVVACRDGGYIYTSTNKGTNLTARASSRSWKAVASSSDGSVLVAVDGAPGYLYLSTDSGVTWTAQSNGPSATWSAVAISPDGTKVVAAVKGGQIYISANKTTIGTTGYLTGSQYASIELQYIGDGQFIPISYVGTIQAH